MLARRSRRVVGARMRPTAYRRAGYDFLVLTDHFEARWGWAITDTTAARTDGFTTLLGAELSSADWDDEDVFWVNAIGLPADFRRPPTASHTPMRSRARRGPARTTCCCIPA